MAVPGDDVTLEWTSDLHEHELQHLGHTHDALIEAIVTGLKQRGTPEQLTEAVGHRLRSLGPAFRADDTSFPQRRINLPAPHEPNGRDRGAMVRPVAQAALAAGTAAGSYADRDAMAIETQIVHPTLEAELLRRLGDATGGGHLYPGLPGKSPSPQNWSADRVLHEISDIATDPAAWDNAINEGSRTVLTGTRGGVDIRVIVDTLTGEIVTGYPPR